jgi:hypothetical protein
MGQKKPLSWWASFLKDLGIGKVFDTTSGSAGAAIGAHDAYVQYDGICCNTLHKIWCEKLMSQAMFAIIADGGPVPPPSLSPKIVHLFGPSVDEGMRMLKAEKAGSKEEEKKESQKKEKKENEKPEGVEVSESDEDDEEDIF